MLDQLAAEHRGERFVVVWKGILLGVEVIDVAGESFAIGRSDFAMIDAAEFAVVASAHVAIAELAAERGRDLQVRAHFENAIARPARRGDLQSLHQACFVRAEIDRKSTRLNSSHLGISYAVF